MTPAEALVVFDQGRYWSISRGGCSIHFPYLGVRATVRRKKGESLSAMIVRCGVLAHDRRRRKIS